VDVLTFVPFGGGVAGLIGSTGMTAALNPPRITMFFKKTPTSGVAYVSDR
jgi:hypothetical protein